MASLNLHSSIVQLLDGSKSNNKNTVFPTKTNNMASFLPANAMMDMSAADVSSKDHHHANEEDDYMLYSDDSSDEDEDEDDDDMSEGSSDDDDEALDMAEAFLKQLHQTRNNANTANMGGRVQSDPSLSSLMRQGMQNAASNASPRRRLKKKKSSDSQDDASNQDHHHASEQATTTSHARTAPANRRDSLLQNNSMGNLKEMIEANEAQMEEGKRTSKLHTSSSMNNFLQLTQMTSAQEASTSEASDDPMANVKPDDHLASLLGGTPETFSYDQLEGFFLPVKPEYVQAWTAELTKAIRTHDLEGLKSMWKERGYRLQACSNFGETIAHLCIRRGTAPMLSWLVKEANISLRVCCDYGRTPLHDAAWSLTSNPESYQMMELVLTECPMQLLIRDKRGFTPLNYVPRNRWAECNAFLDRQASKGNLPQKIEATATVVPTSTTNGSTAE